MKPLTPEERAELERLHREATPGPWEATDFSEDGGMVWAAGERINHERTMNRVAVIERQEDATLIAAARNALPRLLEQIATLEAALGRLSSPSWVVDIREHMDAAADNDEDVIEAAEKHVAEMTEIARAAFGRKP
jgi:hypothetical protein